MSRNGKAHPPRPRIEVHYSRCAREEHGRQSSATPEQAAAIAAGIEQFLRDTAPAPNAVAAGPNPWLRAALFEGVGHDPAGPSPWGDPEPWGRALPPVS